MNDILINALAVSLILFAFINVYFVWHGWHLYTTIKPPSPVLRSLFIVKLLTWLAGSYIAVIAARTIFDLPALPFSGVGLGIVILILETSPAIIWFGMRRFLSDDMSRTEQRDAERDVERDQGRDIDRDIDRDIQRDPARDLQRDTRQDSLREE